MGDLSVLFGVFLIAGTVLTVLLLPIFLGWMLLKLIVSAVFPANRATAMDRLQTAVLRSNLRWAAASLLLVWFVYAMYAPHRPPPPDPPRMKLIAAGVECTLPVKYRSWTNNEQWSPLLLTLPDLEPSASDGMPTKDSLLLEISTRDPSRRSRADFAIRGWRADASAKPAQVPNINGFAFYLDPIRPFYAKKDVFGRPIHLVASSQAFLGAKVTRSYNDHLDVKYSFSLDRFAMFDSVDQAVLEFVGRYCAFSAVKDVGSPQS